MPRKTEQEIELDEQIRFLKAEQRKCRTSSGRLKIADRLLKLYAMRFPSPIAEAVAVAKATKLKMKAEKLVVDQAKVEDVRKPSEWLNRPNPVEEQVQRAAVRIKIREQRAELEASQSIDGAVAVPVVAATEAVAVPVTSTEVTVSPEMQQITRDAEAAALKHSTGSAGAGIAPSAVSRSITTAWSHPLPQVDPFTEYQEKAAMEDQLRQRHHEQHPVRGDVRDEGRLIDSYTGRPVKRES